MTVSHCERRGCVSENRSLPLSSVDLPTSFITIHKLSSQAPKASRRRRQGMPGWGGTRAHGSAYPVVCRDPSCVAWERIWANEGGGISWNLGTSHFLLWDCPHRVESPHLWELGGRSLGHWAEGVACYALCRLLSAHADSFLELSKGVETGTWHIYVTKTCIYLLYVIESYVQHPRLRSRVTDCHTEKLRTGCVARSPSAHLRDPAERWVLADGFLTTQGFTRVADSERSALGEFLGKDGVSQVRPLCTNKCIADMVRMMTAGQLWCQKPIHSLEILLGHHTLCHLEPGQPVPGLPSWPSLRSIGLQTHCRTSWCLVSASSSVPWPWFARPNYRFYYFSAVRVRLRCCYRIRTPRNGERTLLSHTFS